MVVAPILAMMLAAVDMPLPAMGKATAVQGADLRMLHQYHKRALMDLSMVLMEALLKVTRYVTMAPMVDDIDGRNTPEITGFRLSFMSRMG